MLFKHTNIIIYIVYDHVSNEPGSKVRAFQDAVKKITGVAPALFIGRGFLQYSFGLIPRRYPITTVVGEPIATIASNEPTNKQVDELHEQFTEALIKLFEEHKHKYIMNAEKTELIID